MMELDASAVPEALRPNWNELPPAALKLFKDYAKAVETRAALEAAHDDDDEEEDEEVDDSEFLRMNEDDEDVWDEESAYLEMLANEVCGASSCPFIRVTDLFPREPASVPKPPRTPSPTALLMQRTMTMTTRTRTTRTTRSQKSLGSIHRWMA